MSNNVAVSKLIEYLRIKSVHPEPDYDSVVRFLREYSNEIGFDSYQEIEVSPKRIVCLMSYYGKSPEKKSILLNSHTDVVPVDERFWKCDPFEGKRYENGDIYGRGVQDMKSVGIMHLELIRKLKENNLRPERTIHVSFVPDEEIGGRTGFEPFLETEQFQKLNVGVALDEGMASPTEEYFVYYGERLMWPIFITCRGNAGHGSRFIEKTAAEKLQKIINSFLSYREEQKEKLNSCSCLKLGDVTTVNLTQISGGIARNIVPAEFKVTFDIRVTPKTDLKEFEDSLKSWIENAVGDDDPETVSYEFFKNRREKFYLTSIDEQENPWWKSFKDSCNKLDSKLSIEIFPARTDSCYLREKGIDAFGFTPLNHTPTLLHDHNEFVNEKKFLEGIEILYKVVLDLANLQ